MQKARAALRPAHIQTVSPFMVSTTQPSHKIIFYDIPSKLPQQAWSPNTWKTRFSLNYKKIPYETEWIELPDIEGHCKKLGISPTGHHDPFYTLPAIHDPSTGTYLADSLKIAQYLEGTYPSTPSLFPDNTLGLQAAFMYAFHKQLGPMWRFTYAPEYLILNKRCAGYVRRKTEEKFGRTLKDLVLEGKEKEGGIEWEKFKAGLGRVDAWYVKGSGPFMQDACPSWADFVVASYVMWWKSIWGEDSKEWNDIASWHGGRWAKLLENLKDYQEIL